MPFGFFGFNSVVSLLLVGAGELLELIQRIPVKDITIPDTTMHVAWEKRLVQIGLHIGEEVQLVQKSNENGFWVVQGARGLHKL